MRNLNTRQRATTTLLCCDLKEEFLSPGTPFLIFCPQSRYFMDPGVHALQYMDAISGKDLGYRINFYHNLREILNLIPKVW